MLIALYYGKIKHIHILLIFKVKPPSPMDTEEEVASNKALPPPQTMSDQKSSTASAKTTG